MSKYIATGIDVGLDGGIVTLGDASRVLQRELPATEARAAGRSKRRFYVESIMRRQIECALDLGSQLFIVEEQKSIPGKGGYGSFHLGEGYGLWRGLLVGMKVPFEVVPAKQWQKELFTRLDTGDTKAKAISYVSRMLPELDLLKTKRGRKAHDGFADAACMAVYGCRRLIGS